MVLKEFWCFCWNRVWNFFSTTTFSEWTIAGDFSRIVKEI